MKVALEPGSAELKYVIPGLLEIGSALTLIGFGPGRRRMHTSTVISSGPVTIKVMQILTPVCMREFLTWMAFYSLRNGMAKPTPSGTRIAIWTRLQIATPTTAMDF